MSIILECEHGHKLRVRDELHGKNVRCPKCQAIVHVDASAESQFQAIDSTPPILSTHLPRSKRSTKRKKPSGWPVGVLVGLGVAAALLVALAIGLTWKSSGPPLASSPDVRIPAQSSSTTSDRVSPLVGANENEEPEPRTAAAAKPASVGPPQSRSQLPTTVGQQKQLAVVDRSLKLPGVATAPIANGPRQVPVSKQRVVVWDATEAESSQDPEGSPNRRAGWEQVPIATGATHQFRGDCVIENENLLIRLQRLALPDAIIVPKVGVGAQAAVPIFVVGRGPASVGAKSIRVAAISDGSATIEFEPTESPGNGAKVACRLDAGKYWLELKSLAKAEQVSIGLRSQFVIVPSEFGEDLICDSLLLGGLRSVPIPGETEVLALQCDGNFMTMLSYPSTEQAGTLTIATDSSARNHGTTLSAYVDSMSAHFKGKSVYVAILPHNDNWYYEAINKKYSASGQYVIPWQPPHAGVWRLAGRVNGRYFVSDVPSDRFVYACSLSGTLDCLFGYFSVPDAASAGPVTPLAIEREVGEWTKAAAIRTESAGDGLKLMHRKTRYRDVCNSADDMKDTWRNKPDEMRNDPAYVRNLLEDCQAILERIDRRLNEYRELSEHLGTDLLEMQQKKKGTGAAGVESFAAAVQTQQGRLKGLKLIRVSRGINAIGTIRQNIQTPKAGRLNVAELDRLAESMRDVANGQEVQLKKLRAVTLQLADICLKRRTNGPPTVQPYVTLVGRQCRKVLRNRDPEE